MHVPTIVSGAVLAALLALPAAARNLEPNLVPDSGFEEGAAGWEFSGPYRQAAGPDADVGAAIISTEAHSGKRCLRIDTRGREAEVNAVSAPFAVQPGAKYALSSWVRLVAPGSFGFKVTIEWLGAGDKHLRYDNDWHGQATGHTWLAHGGDFTAPGDATRARIILGILPGGAMLFDDISLRMVGPELVIVGLATADAVCIANQPIELRCVLRNPGGR